MNPQAHIIKHPSTSLLRYLTPSDGATVCVADTMFDVFLDADTARRVAATAASMQSYRQLLSSVGIEPAVELEPRSAIATDSTGSTDSTRRAAPSPKGGKGVVQGLAWSGRGAVIVAGGAIHLTNAWLAIKSLDRNGWKLPIELWHDGPAGQTVVA